jgi:hypothetical protein
MEITKRKKRRIKISANAAILSLLMLLLLVCYVYTGDYGEALASSFVLAIPAAFVLSFFSAVFGF